MLADQNGEGVFQFGAALGQRGGFGFGGGQFGFGAGDIEFVADAAFEAAAHQPHLLLAQVHRAGDGGDFRVERAEREIVLRDVGLQREQDVVERGERGLGVGAGAFETAPDAAPQINFVAQIERRAERVGRDVAEARVPDSANSAGA